MPYDEQTVKELHESEEITPLGIQLEVNAEIFTTIHNLLRTLRKDQGIQKEDEERLVHLWRKTIRAMSKIELRKGHGIPMDKQIEMLEEAYAIETKYTSDQLFHPQTRVKITKESIIEESAFTPEEMDAFFESTVWPSVIEGKTGGK